MPAMIALPTLLLAALHQTLRRMMDHLTPQKCGLWVTVCMALCSTPLPAQPLENSTSGYANRPDVQTFSQNMADKYTLPIEWIQNTLAQARYSSQVAKLILPPPLPSSKNWQAYRGRFVEPVRIRAGIKFWQDNAATLARAENEYGVPAEIIVGILGVESLYGKYLGNFRVLDALTTLAFDYPDTPNRENRSAMFRNQLEAFLAWSHETATEPLSLRGSYAGAVGIPQFMPVSIREYAVDFDGDGKLDLRNSTADAIGSVARFLRLHGWEPGRPITWKIADDEGSQALAQTLADGEPEPHYPLSKFIRAGLLLKDAIDTEAENATPVLVVDLSTPGMPPEYQLGLQNFYVLTRYNRSFFYAQAVHELGHAIKSSLP